MTREKIFCYLKANKSSTAVRRGKFKFILTGDWRGRVLHYLNISRVALCSSFWCVCVMVLGKKGGSWEILDFFLLYASSCSIWIWISGLRQWDIEFHMNEITRWVFRKKLLWALSLARDDWHVFTVACGRILIFTQCRSLISHPPTWHTIQQGNLFEKYSKTIT